MSQNTCKAVTVLLPFHVYDQFLASAVKSVFQSKNVQVNLILIDDRVDKSIEILEDGDFRVVKTNGAIGYYNSLNLAKEFVNTEYVAIMNSDDIVHPLRFITQILDLERTSADISLCQFRKFKSFFLLPSKLGKIQAGIPVSVSNLFGSYGSNATWCTRSTFWREKIVFKDLAMGDWVLGLELGKNTTYVISPKTLYYYRQHRSQITASENYHSIGIEAVYNPWNSLNTTLRITPLNKDTFKKFVLPFASNELVNNSEVIQILRWSRELLTYYPAAISLVIPRLIYLAFTRKTKSQSKILILKFIVKHPIQALYFLFSLFPRPSVFLMRDLLK